MSTRNRIPPLLEPYLQLPSQGSQLLLTGVLDASPTWLVTRLLRSLLETQEAINSPTTKEGDNVSVILVSWLRDFEFWKGEARRGGGLDLLRLVQQNRFVFIDGLTNLFPLDTTTTTTCTPSPSPSPSPSPTRNLPTRTPIPPRGGPIPSRNPAPQPQPTQPTPSTPSTPSNTSTPASLNPSLPSTLQTLTKTITTLLANSPTQKIHLILDTPTLLLSTTPSPSATLLSHFLLSLRSTLHSTTLVLPTDSPFLDAARPDTSKPLPTPLEAELAAFAVQQAHVSRWLVGLRALETGRARDVSGVVRVCRGGAWDDDDEEEEGVAVKHAVTNKELEALYFVQPDGGVRVFERGEASVG